MSVLTITVGDLAQAALSIIGVLMAVYAVAYTAARAVFKARAKHPTTTNVNLPAEGIKISVAGLTVANPHQLAEHLARSRGEL